MQPKKRGRKGPKQVDYWTLAELRYYVRRFLRARELAAREAGIEPQQYLLLLQVKGLGRGQPATISALAERLQLRHHSRRLALFSVEELKIEGPALVAALKRLIG